MRSTCCDSLEEYYRLLASWLVRSPADLRVSQYSTPLSVNVTVQAREGDHGRLIGVEGRIFKACDTILHESALANGLKIRLIIDSPRNNGRTVVPFKYSEAWSRTDDVLLADLLYAATSVLYFGSIEIDHHAISHSATQFSLKRQPHRTVEREQQLANALIVWFESAGRNKGRAVFLDII